jgi:hypothetical protein
LILEAFSEYLHAADPRVPATDVLGKWLWQKLKAEPLTNVDRVLHCEMTVCAVKTKGGASSEEPAPRYVQGGGKDSYVFKGTSESGKRLLKSLYEYCCSYEQQKWARWVHGIRASDFNGRRPDE